MRWTLIAISFFFLAFSACNSKSSGSGSGGGLGATAKPADGIAWLGFSRWFKGALQELNSDQERSVVSANVTYDTQGKASIKLFDASGKESALTPQIVEVNANYLVTKSPSLVLFTESKTIDYTKTSTPAPIAYAKASDGSALIVSRKHFEGSSSVFNGPAGTSTVVEFEGYRISTNGTLSASFPMTYDDSGDGNLTVRSLDSSIQLTSGRSGDGDLPNMLSGPATFNGFATEAIATASSF